MVTDLARRYARALASGDTEAIARCYHPDARSYGPLAWPEQGAGAIAASLARSAARLDALETELHDAFADPAGERAALRLVRRWSQGATRRSAIETRYLRLADGLITEEFAGPKHLPAGRSGAQPVGHGPGRHRRRPEPRGPGRLTDQGVRQAARDRPRAVRGCLRPQRSRRAAGPVRPRVHPLQPDRLGPSRSRPLGPFVQQFHQGFPGLRLALLDQFSSADGTRVAFRFGMRWHNTGTFFGNPPTGDHGTHGEFHSLRLAGGRVVEQVVTDISYGIPRYELTVWHRQYPTDTEDPAPLTSAAEGGTWLRTQARLDRRLRW